MIIQNSTTNQAVPPVRLVSDDAPRVVSQTPEQTITLQPPSLQQLNNAVETINQAIQQQSNQNLEFSVDVNTNKPVVRLVDAATGDLIRQMPSKEVLAIASSIDQFLQFQHGLLINQKA